MKITRIGLYRSQICLRHNFELAVITINVLSGCNKMLMIFDERFVAGKAMVMNMQNCQRFSNVTKEYLECFYKILDEMISDMTDAQLTGSISQNFIVQMIPHHMAAIEMSKNILRYTTFIPVQNIALNIISEQTKSIEDMKCVLPECAELLNCERDLSLYRRRLDRIMQTMFTDMRDAYSSNNINENFMREMIPHHKGAICMGENALNFEICSGLKPIIHSIIVSQKEGVRKMEHLLRCIQ